MKSMLADLGEGVVDDFLRNTGSLIWRSGSHLKLQGTAGTIHVKCYPFIIDLTLIRFKKRSCLTEVRFCTGMTFLDIRYVASCIAMTIAIHQAETLYVIRPLYFMLYDAMNGTSILS